ncbi:MAG TPA: Uma2 family endonuclease [Tepidisphaeraceae bacterium]|jgi:Uma2 family endonuclease
MTTLTIAVPPAANPATPTSPYRTAADLDRLRADLGDVPPERIRLTPPPGTATEDDCVRTVESKTGGLVELVAGTLVEKPVGYREAMLAAEIVFHIQQFVRTNRLGIVLPPDGMHRMTQGNVREPDVSFTAWGDMPGRQLPDGKVFPSSPTLAIEVLSESNTAKEMRAKRQEYFGSITKLVWQVDLETRTIDVFANPADSDAFTRLTVADTLDGGAALPGFTLPVAEVFAVLDRGPQG